MISTWFDYGNLKNHTKHNFQILFYKWLWFLMFLIVVKQILMISYVILTNYFENCMFLFVSKNNMSSYVSYQLLWESHVFKVFEQMIMIY